MVQTMQVKLEDFEKYRKRLLRIARNMTKFRSGITYQYDYDLAQDIVQDCYLRFHKLVIKEYPFETPDHLKQILIKNIWRISMTSRLNKGVSYKSKERVMDFDYLPEHLHPYSENKSIEIEDIHKAINSLCFTRGTRVYGKDRANIMFANIEGYSIEEIAGKFNKTKREIINILYNSRKKLCKTLNYKSHS